MGSGGGLLLGGLHGLAIAKADTPDHLGEPLGAIQPAPATLGRLGQLVDHGQGRLPGQAALGPVGAEPDGGERAFNGVRGSNVLPVLGGEVIERQQRLTILGQTGHGLVVLGAILDEEAVEGILGGLAVLGFLDRVQILLGFAL